MKAASNSNMAGVSAAAAAAAGQEIFVEGKGSTRQRPQGFVVQDRFNYLTAGKKMLQKCSMIGLTADAVSVGQDHILNVFLWNPDKKEAYLGPPQAVCLTCPISTRSEARMKQESCLSVVDVFSCGQDFGRHLGFKPGPRHDGKKHDMLRPLEAELEAKIGQSTLPFWEKKRANFEKSWRTFLGSPKSDSPRFGFGPFPEDDKCH